MEIINYPAFDEKCYFEEMPNGLKVYIFHKPDYSSSAVAFGTPYGALDIHQNYHGKHYDFHPGIAHFMEHKVFEDEEGDVMGRFMELGANVNAFTSYQETVYHFFLTGRHNFDKCLNLLLDFVQDFNVSKESVEKEKPIINQEISMYFQQPITRLINETYSALYHNYPLKYDIGGNRETVNATTKEELDECYRINYHPSNMILSVVSFIDPEEIMAIIRANQNGKNFTKESVAVNENEPEPIEVAKKHYSFHMDVNASKVIYAAKLDYSKFSDDEQIVIEFVLSKYFQMCFSNLNPDYQKWLDEGLINDFFGCEFEVESDYAYVLFYSECDDEEQFKAFIDDILANFKPSATKFDELKRRFIGEFFNEFNDFENFNITFMRNALDNIDIFRIYDLIANTTFEDLISEVNKLDLSHYSLISLLPNKE